MRERSKEEEEENCCTYLCTVSGSAEVSVNLLLRSCNALSRFLYVVEVCVSRVLGLICLFGQCIHVSTCSRIMCNNKLCMGHSPFARMLSGRTFPLFPRDAFD